MTKKYHVSTVCNALVDIIFEATDKDLHTLDLNKGKMHLVDKKQQETVLQYFNTQNQTVELGGSALNLIKAMAQLKKNTFFSGVVSDDAFGEKIKHKLAKLKIQNKLANAPTEATGSCVILVTPDGERTFNTYLGASRLYTEDFIPHDDIAQSQVFHFTGYQWDTDQQKEAILKTITLAKKNKCILSFDLADPFVVKSNKTEFIDLIKKYADIVFANRDEAKLLYDLNPKETAAKINEHGTTAIIKLDKDGALIKASNQEVIKVPSIKTNVVDTTGAGDMFAAGFLYGMTSDYSLKECGHVATQLASDVISRYGAFLSNDIITKIRSNQY